ncbi:mediator of RNA polymerase II transcription subunit 6 [Paracoccidioides lutzii Pb01]|uniref:Mediator of RNA polymerase II transcription subunit 6 n=1 Tax=Paracoccidioides lutzii (strain ATCC MYA-826 / Pb01) TaxID=502779 RepID=C1GXG4_PARBA|nr:mediator of RNA polymerase II transcription subunit 6 [Paracoccidioides lutzii Pb01]EEH41252.2 mediator of RNA polymerase II transcription subunit 6 [Paracoccidioides lutzii Pb01]
MAAQPDVPLEEITWRSPHHVQMMGGFLHSNNILFYFAESPFFDATSNNASLAIQASYNENFRHFIETREAFEGRLKTMQGVEFMVLPQEPSNVWVIRKQVRKKRASDDEIQVLATYFVVGDSVYMAPSVLKVIGSRMLSTVTSLTKALSVASPLPLFSPSYGHTYMPPVPKYLDPSRPGQQSTQQSTANTPIPDLPAQSRAGTTPPLATTATTTTNAPSSLSQSTTMQDSRSFAEAFNLLSRYGDEFMDDAPLLGEPGSFIIGKASTEPLATRQQAKAPQPKAPTPVPTVGVGVMSKPGTPAGTGVGAGASTWAGAAVPAIKTDAATIGAARAGKGGEKSPTTPGGGKIRRKKSKVSSATAAHAGAGAGMPSS